MPTNQAATLLQMISEVEGKVAALAVTDDLQELRILMRQPGWTTNAEQTFVLAALDALSQQLQTVASMRLGLLAAARQIGAAD
jgi:hypothetical protein